MTKDDIIKKNLDLHAEWMKYIFEHPDVLDKIPKGAVLVILPEDDKELYEENYKILEENKNKGIPVVVVTMKVPKPHISNIEVIAAIGTFDEKNVFGYITEILCVKDSGIIQV